MLPSIPKLLLLTITISFVLAGAAAECGNSNCEPGENFSNCQVDCPSPLQLELTIDSPSNGSAFLRGDEITIKAHAAADGKTLINLDYINAYGFFGNTLLYDDGMHSDGKWKDGYFASAFKIKPVQQAGFFSIAVTARLGQTFVSKKIIMEVKPELSAKVETDKKTYYLGDEISFSGELKRHEEPLDKNFELVVSDAKQKQYKIPVETGKDGKFSAKLHTSLINAPGNWSAAFSVQDDLNNTGNAEAGFQVKNPEDRASLSIVLVEEPKIYYRRGSDLLLLAKVFDDLGNEIKDANIVLETPLGDKIPFEKTKENIFFATTIIPIKMPSGNQNFFITAESQSQEGLKSGDKNISLNIKEIGIRTELVSPKSSQALVGDTIVFTVKMNYENSEPVPAKSVPAKVNNKQILLNYDEPGIYSGTYFVEEEDYLLDFRIDFDDGFQNKASFSTQIIVNGVSIAYYFQKYWQYIIGFTAILLVCALIARKKIKKSLETRRLKKQESLIGSIIEKEEKEFVDGKISRAEFNKSTAKYEAELVVIRGKIKETEAHKNAKKTN